jgi:hypothetical protein
MGVANSKRRHRQPASADVGCDGLEHRLELSQAQGSGNDWNGHGVTIIGRAMKRSDLIVQTRRLIDEGERLQRAPSIAGLRVWLQLSDELLSAAWGQMDRYHLSWLMVGRPDDAIRGRKMTPTEEADYVREVAGQKTAALQMSLRAVEDQNMPFVGESPA